jgi:hypothetical protein
MFLFFLFAYSIMQFSASLLHLFSEKQSLKHKKAWTLSYPRSEALRIACIIDKSPSTLRADVRKLIRNDAFQNFSGFRAVLNK